MLVTYLIKGSVMARAIHLVINEENANKRNFRSNLEWFCITFGLARKCRTWSHKGNLNAPSLPAAPFRITPTVRGCARRKSAVIRMTTLLPQVETRDTPRELPVCITPLSGRLAGSAEDGTWITLLTPAVKKLPKDTDAHRQKHCDLWPSWLLVRGYEKHKDCEEQ